MHRLRGDLKSTRAPDAVTTTNPPSFFEKDVTNLANKFEKSIKERNQFKRQFKTVMTFDDEKITNLNGGRFGSNKNEFL